MLLGRTSRQDAFKETDKADVSMKRSLISLSLGRFCSCAMSHRWMVDAAEARMMRCLHVGDPFYFDWLLYGRTYFGWFWYIVRLAVVWEMNWRIAGLEASVLWFVQGESYECVLYVGSGKRKLYVVCFWIYKILINIHRNVNKDKTKLIDKFQFAYVINC